MNQKIIAILGVAVIFLASSTIYFATTNNPTKQSPFSKVDEQPKTILPEQQPAQTNVEKPQPINETAGWKTFSSEKYGFDFKYPQIFNPEDINNGNWSTNVEDMLAILDNSDGKIWVYIENRKLDPKNIEGVYEKVDDKNIKTLNINGNVFYSYIAGDGACGGDVFNYALRDKTLIISFSSCDGEKGKGLHQYVNTILATLKFTK